MKKNPTLEYLKSECTFDKASPKWVSAGADILKYIGNEVVFVEFTRKDSESSWETTSKAAKIESISDFDPLTGTYRIDYTISGESKNERIIPQGFSFNVPDRDNWMHRFLPYSLHFSIGEEELYFQRLRTLYNTRPTLDSVFLESMSKSKDWDNYNNVVAVIDTDIEDGAGIGLVSFRIHSVSGYYSYKDGSGYTIRDGSGHYFTVRQKTGSPDISFKADSDFIGKLKIIDLKDE